MKISVFFIVNISDLTENRTVVLTNNCSFQSLIFSVNYYKTVTKIFAAKSYKTVTRSYKVVTKVTKRLQRFLLLFVNRLLIKCEQTVKALTLRNCLIAVNNL